jgi:hypothetical protein
MKKVEKFSKTDSIGKGGSMGDKKGAERKRKKIASILEVNMKLTIHFSKLLCAVFFITLLEVKKKCQEKNAHKKNENSYTIKLS